MTRQPYTADDWKFLAGLVRKLFWANRRDTDEWTFRRDLSILKALVRRFGVRETEAMVRGAASLKWKDLRSVHAVKGLGRRWAVAAHWAAENSRRVNHMERLGDVLNEAMRRAAS